MLEKLKNIIINKKLLLISFFIIISLFTIDILTKRLAFEKVDNIYQKTAGVHAYIHINNYLNIVKVVNTGVSFGMFRNLKYAQFILSFITIIIISFVLYLLFNVKTKYKMITYSLIIAGGLGNIYDRIFFGGVFDFLDFHLGTYHWPAFNVADSLICIGVFLLFFEDIFFEKITKGTNNF